MNDRVNLATGIGAPVPRVEDRRLLTGAGQFSDDINRDIQLHAVMVRAEHAHAGIKGIAVKDARNMPEVRTVLTGGDWLSDGLNPMPAGGNPKDVELRNRDDSDIFYTPLYPLAIDRVRRVGEIVAMVVAETTSQARDSTERIVIDYRPLPALADAQAALDPGASPLWDQMTNNVSVDDVKGDQQACDAAFARAAHIVQLETDNQRVTGVPMEPRVALAEYDAKIGQFTLEAGGQGVIRFRNELAATFGVALEKVRAVSRDVGGGYGTRNHTYPEFALALWAAKRTGLPVKWVCDRGEGGTTAAPPAVINAIVDALSEFDVRHMDMPATPERIWRAIHQT